MNTSLNYLKYLIDLIDKNLLDSNHQLFKTSHGGFHSLNRYNKLIQINKLYHLSQFQALKSKYMVIKIWTIKFSFVREI